LIGVKSQNPNLKVSKNTHQNRFDLCKIKIYINPILMLARHSENKMRWRINDIHYIELCMSYPKTLQALMDTQGAVFGRGQACLTR